MAELYPYWLPAPLKAGKSRRQAPGFRVIEPYRGRMYVQPIGTETPVVWDLTFRFTQTQAQAFWLWFETGLGKGVEPFQMLLRTEFGNVQHELQFLPDGLLDATEDGPHFTYRAQVLARKLVIPQEYMDDADDVIAGGLRSMVLSEYTFSVIAGNGLRSMVLSEHTFSI